jgi:hypothetical protein
MGLHQTKKLLQKKGNNYQNQKKTHRIEKIFASDSLDKGPISRIYKDLKKLNAKKTSKNPTNKWANDLHSFQKKDTWLINTRRNVQHP